MANYQEEMAALDARAAQARRECKIGLDPLIERARKVKRLRPPREIARVQYSCGCEVERSETSRSFSPCKDHHGKVPDEFWAVGGSR